MRLTQALRRAVQQRPAAIASHCNGRSTRFDTLLDRVQRLAGGLRDLGIQTGEPVAMLALNSDRYLEFYLAVPWLGARCVPLNFRWSVEEVIYALRDSQATAIVLDDSFAAHADALRAACPTLKALLFSGDGACPAGMVGWDALIERSAPIDEANGGDDELYGVFYTGGTTGAPKGVLLTHRNLTMSALGLMAEGPFAENCIGLHAAPMFHLADMMMTCCLLLRGGTHVMLSAFKPDVLLDIVQRHAITELLLVPAMMQAVVDHPDFSRYQTHSVRNLLYGASPASEALIDRATAAFANTAFYQVYGMTELAATATTLPPSEHRAATRTPGRLRSAGRSFSHVLIRVVDGQGQDLPHGRVGEIIVRGPNVMRGYLNQPKASDDALAGGWMHTGDMGYLDEQGYLYIVDRLKDMIISGGENVYCAEVENALARHPAIAACAVIGVPSAEWGETVHAVIVLKPGAELDLASLQQHCRELIAGYKCPRSFEVRPALPISAAGKVLKTELRKPHWEGRTRAIN